MSSLELEVYEIFKNRFSEKEAAKVIEFFESKSEEKITQKKDVFMTKDDKVELVTRIESTKSELIKWSFIFWVGSVITILGGLLAILKLFFEK
jgi:hypothetical protein